MYIWKHNQRRCNPFATYVDDNGTTHSKVPVDLYEEVAEPTPPEDYDPDHYYRTEQDDTPYVTYSRKSDMQIAEFEIEKLKGQIRALEAAESDGMQKTIRQSILQLSETIIAMVGVLGLNSETLKSAMPAAQTLLTASNHTYQRVKQLEDAIIPLRSSINQLEGQ